MYVERFVNPKGELFVKAPLINNLLNNRGWRATPEANSVYAHTAIGKPVTLMLNKEESMFHDYHPFKTGVPVNDRDAHIAFAEKYAYAHIVDVGQDSGSYKAASNEMPWFFTMKIEDPTMAEEWKKPNSKLLPPAFSPGILHLEGPDTAISKYEILHVASVPSGAFGPKFVSVGKCAGNAMECVPELRAAGNYKLEPPERPPKITNKKDWTSLEYYNRHLLNVSSGALLQDPAQRNSALWVAQKDGRSCDVCERLDGSVFDKDDALNHYPAHNNCRCEVKQELTEEDLLGASYISPKIKRARANKNATAATAKTKLKAASYTTYKERCGVCPKDVFSSLLLKAGSSSENLSMSMNSNAQSTPGPGTFGTAEVRDPSGGIMATQEVQPKTKPTIKYKKLRFTGQTANSTEPQPNGENDEGGEGGGEGAQSDAKADAQFRSSKYYGEMQKMKDEIQKRTAIWDYKEKRYQLEKIITPDLFTDSKGRFKQKEWEAEIERAIKENVPMQWLQMYYQNKKQLMQIPELQVKRGSSAFSDSLVQLQGASSLENDEEKIRAEKALRLNGGFD